MLYVSWIYIIISKNQVKSPFFSWDIADWRIPQFHWLRVFCFITQKPTFSQIWYLCMQKTNDMTLFSTRYRESNVEIFRKTYKTLLIKLIKPIFGQKWIFVKILASASYYGLPLGKKTKNNYWAIIEQRSSLRDKLADRRANGQTAVFS